MEERIGLFRDCETGVFSVSDLCGRYGISRETFYVWKRRRDSGEDHWFEELSHAVERCPHATPARLIERIVAVRRKFPFFGPKKIKKWLETMCRMSAGQRARRSATSSSEPAWSKSAAAVVAPSLRARSWRLQWR